MIVSFFGRKLESIHKNMAENPVYVLMNHPPPIGYIDVFFIKLVQFFNGNGIDDAIGQCLHTFHRGLVVIERIHPESDVAFHAEPGRSVHSVVMKDGSGYSAFNEISLVVSLSGLHNIGMFRIYFFGHARFQCLQRFVRYGIIRPHFIDNIFHSTDSSTIIFITNLHIIPI